MARRGVGFRRSGQAFLVMTPSQRGTLFVNPKVVKPQEIKSYKDLLNPKWRKKIVLDDPTRAGPGQATFTFFYLHPELGPNFIRALANKNRPCCEITRRRLTASPKKNIPY